MHGCAWAAPGVPLLATWEALQLLVLKASSQHEGAATGTYQNLQATSCMQGCLRRRSESEARPLQTWQGNHKQSTKAANSSMPASVNCKIDFVVLTQHHIVCVLLCMHMRSQRGRAGPLQELFEAQAIYQGGKTQDKTHNC